MTIDTNKFTLFIQKKMYIEISSKGKEISNIKYFLEKIK